MSLRDNLINLLNQSFFKTEEKSAKYMEWLESEYTNGKWYINETTIPTPTAGNGGAQYIQSSYAINQQGTHENMSVFVSFSGVNNTIYISNYDLVAPIDAYYVAIDDNGFYAEVNNKVFESGDWFQIKQPSFIYNNNLYTGFNIKIEFNGSQWTITEV